MFPVLPHAQKQQGILLLLFVAHLLRYPTSATHLICPEGLTLTANPLNIVSHPKQGITLSFRLSNDFHVH